MPSVIRTGALLSEVLGRLVEEGIKADLTRRGLTEKENQDTTAAALMGNDSGEDAASDPEDVTSSKTMDADSEELRTGEVSFDNIVGKLNAIRSGRSFRDDDIKHAMEAYVKSLKKPERVALLAFLKGIAQIVTGEVPGQQAVDPADPEPAVAMQKNGQKGGAETAAGQRKSIKPNVVVRQPQGEQQKQKKQSAEDTSAPVPVPIKARKK